MLEQSETERKEFCLLAVSEEAEVADAHKPARQEVKQEAAQELFDGQGHEPLLVAVSGVAPTEGDMAVGKSNQPAVGDVIAVVVEAGFTTWFRTEDELGALLLSPSYSAVTACVAALSQVLVSVATPPLKVAVPRPVNFTFPGGNVRPAGRHRRGPRNGLPIGRRIRTGSCRC